MQYSFIPDPQERSCHKMRAGNVTKRRSHRKRQVSPYLFLLCPQGYPSCKRQKRTFLHLHLFSCFQFYKEVRVAKFPNACFKLLQHMRVCILFPILDFQPFLLYGTTQPANQPATDHSTFLTKSLLTRTLSLSFLSLWGI